MRQWVRGFAYKFYWKKETLLKPGMEQNVCSCLFMTHPHLKKSWTSTSGWEENKSFKLWEEALRCVHTFLTSYEHGADGEDLLWVCVGWHISKPYTGQTAQSKVEGGHIAAAHWWPAVQHTETPTPTSCPRCSLASWNIPVMLARIPGSLPCDLWPRHVPLTAVGWNAADRGGEQRCQGSGEIWGTQTFGQLMEPTWDKEWENTMNELHSADIFITFILLHFKSTKLDVVLGMYCTTVLYIPYVPPPKFPEQTSTRMKLQIVEILPIFNS